MSWKKFLMQYSKYLPYLAIVMACVIWWLNWVFIKYLQLPITIQTFFRLWVPAVCMGGYLLYKRESILTKDIKTMVLISVWNAVRLYLLTVAFVFTSVANASVALKINILLTAILAYFFLKEKFTITKIISMIIWFGGLLMIGFQKGLTFANDDIKWIGLVILSVFILSGINIVYKQKLKQQSSEYIIFYQSIIGAIGFGVYSLINYPLPDLYTIALATLHWFLIGVVWFRLYFRGLKRIELSHASILTYSEVITAIVRAYIILWEVPSRITYLGTICIIISGVLIIQDKRKKPTITTDL